eukprot:TRINITY_DN5754_c1_g1_i1.p1 TRINITY_DN5754_c1_g1~~TRINITY_DN5754_c1_g1_i1.p1  ORF type:complete len:209 (-),score=4.82 TRINITY_DN5754_c1_g1_i1:71-697(-)
MASPSTKKLPSTPSIKGAAISPGVIAQVRKSLSLGESSLRQHRRALSLSLSTPPVRQSTPTRITSTSLDAVSTSTSSTSSSTSPSTSSSLTSSTSTVAAPRSPTSPRPVHDDTTIVRGGFCKFDGCKSLALPVKEAMGWCALHLPDFPASPTSPRNGSTRRLFASTTPPPPSGLRGSSTSSTTVSSTASTVVSTSTATSATSTVISSA